MPTREICDIFINNLDMLLKKNGMNKTELSNKIGVGKSTVSMWFSKTALPRMDLLDKIADVFGISVSDLLSSSYTCEPPQVQTIAAHFDGGEYTEEELEEIRKFAEFVMSKRKEQ